MRPFLLAALASGATAARYVTYFDQYHTAHLPNKTTTANITHVITAFANSSFFTRDPRTEYKPFMPLVDVRAMFDEGTKVCMAIGGWGDMEGFRAAVKDDASRRLFAVNVNATMHELGYDCVDIDWEYPGGNGADYAQTPNSDRTVEIAAFPMLLQALRDAIGHHHELSIAVPGLVRDMIAYTSETLPQINNIVDFVNVMTYDFMNRRDSVTKHHTDLKTSLETIDAYIARGIAANKLNLGFAFYAKWFTLQPGTDCSAGLGCPTLQLESTDGSDTGLSGALTFEKQFLAPVPVNLTESTTERCGGGTAIRCPNSLCCSEYGFCGDTSAYCGMGCQAGYGRACNGPSPAESFRRARVNSQYDAENGGEWYWDAQNDLFWTWDTPEIMARKFSEIVQARGLGGVMAWSLAEDSYDWSHLLAMQKGFLGTEWAGEAAVDEHEDEEPVRACPAGYAPRYVRV